MHNSVQPQNEASGYVLALGAGRTQYPFIVDALQFGASLIVVDMRFCPEIKELEAQSGGRLILIKEDLKEPERIISKLSRYQISALMPVPVGRVLTTAGLIVDRLGLIGAGFKTVDILTDKIKLNVFMRAHAADGINCTELYPRGQEPCYPCIAKQRFGSGSCGVAFIKDKSARAAFEKKLKGELQLNLDDCYFEQFLDGREFSVNLMIKDGRLVHSFVLEKEMSALPLRYETAYCTALSLNAEQRQECIEQVLSLCSALDLKTCVMQADIIFDDKSAKPYIIDCSPRFSGNSVQALIKKAFGVSLAQSWLKFAAGGKFTSEDPGLHTDSTYFMQLFSFVNTELRAITALPDFNAASGLTEYNCSLELNSLVQRSSSGKFSDFGYFITRADNAQSARQYAKDLLGKFHSVPVYQTTEVCPFCGSRHLHVMPERAEQLMSGLTSKFFAKVLKFTPAYCEDCGCGFSTAAIHPEYSAFICSHYKFPRGSKMQELPNYRYIADAVHKFCAADDFIVEIGCSDGSMLRLLQQNGFNLLLGFDPNAPKYTGGVDIKKELFTADTLMTEQPRAFIFNNTIEMLPDLKEVVHHISDLLLLGGHLFITVPHPAVSHLLQQWRFTLKAFEHLARSYGFSIIDSNIKSVDDIKKELVYCVTLQRSNEYRPYFKESLIRAEFEHTLTVCAQKDSDSEWAKELNRLLNSLKADGECRPEIYCYGSGNFAFRLLSTVPNLNDFEIVFLNSDPDSEGKYTVLPTGEAAEVHYYLNEVQNRSVKMIIVAVQDPAFKHQIVQALTEANCHARTVFMV